MDTGPVLMVSKPLRVELPEPLDKLRKDQKNLELVVNQHQERLKEIGDWKIFPATIEMIARGRFAIDSSGKVYVDGRHMPHGYRPG